MALEGLPVPQRLALSYAPAKARDAALTLLLLDNRLAAILRNRSDVLIAQVKLAWWRDRMGEEQQNWPAGEPLLLRLQQWQVPPSSLVPLIDGWEALLIEELTVSAMQEFAQGRADAWAALAGSFGVKNTLMIEKSAREWALADLALHLDNGAEAQAARTMALASKPDKSRLPRTLRPLAVLHGLSRRALENGSGELLDGPRAALVALRIGLIGR